MNFLASIAAAACAVAVISPVGISGRTFTIQNKCSFSIWPQVQGNPAVESNWEAQPNTQKSINVPDGWSAGRISGKTNNGNDPATLAEFTLGGDQDNYDISNVDGFNLPLAISTNKDCPAPSCSANLNDNCPDELRAKDGSGKTFACKSACKAGIPVPEENCCTGAHDKPDTCPKENVKYYSYFHDGCPDAYAYAYDEHSGVLKTCPTNLQADYTITFCP